MGDKDNNPVSIVDVRQRKNPEIIAHLAAGKSIRETAELCHVSTTTITRRLKRPAFLAQLERARARMIDSAIGSLSQGSAKAAKRLFELMDSTSPTVAISACRSVLEFGLKWLDYQSTSREIEQLKRFAADIKEKNNVRENRVEALEARDTDGAGMVRMPAAPD
jgi:hypothetical protein